MKGTPCGHQAPLAPTRVWGVLGLGCLNEELGFGASVEENFWTNTVCNGIASIATWDVGKVYKGSVKSCTQRPRICNKNWDFVPDHLFGKLIISCSWVLILSYMSTVIGGMAEKPRIACKIYTDELLVSRGIQDMKHSLDASIPTKA